MIPYCVFGLCFGILVSEEMGLYCMYCFFGTIDLQRRRPVLCYVLGSDWQDCLSIPGRNLHGPSDGGGMPIQPEFHIASRHEFVLMVLVNLSESKLSNCI